MSRTRAEPGPGKGMALRPYHATAVTLIGGLLFVAVFFLRYSTIDADLYQFRDDGVITMSVGRNIVDYGFAGVSPSGPIVEASSSPLQTIVYAIQYAVFRFDYAQYSGWQTYVCTFLIGMLFSAFFCQRPLFCALIVTVAALGLSYFYPFFLWHGSGMENSITHVFYLLVVFLLYKAVRDDEVNYWAAVPIFLATIVRIEGVVHIAVLLGFFSAYWWYRRRDSHALRLTAIVAVLWLCFQAARFAYFGDLLPNTAYAQDIGLKDRLLATLFVNTNYISESLRLTKIVVRAQGWWVVAIFVPLCLLTARTWANNFLLLAILVLFVSVSASPFLFGASRIDVARTTTQLTPLLFLAIFFAVFHATHIRRGLLVAVGLLPVSLAAYAASGLGPYYLGWRTKDFDDVRIALAEIAKANSIHRATVSNPDLGVMTWHKQFNVVDLGMLGTPEMAKLRGRLSLGNYYLNVALPDVIESHGGWITGYCSAIFLTREFNEKYEMVSGPRDIAAQCNEREPDRNIWIRRDIKINSQSRERKFLNALQRNLDVRRVEQEIADCRSVNESCAYVARTVYRFIPELRQDGRFDEVVGLFQDPIDRSLLTGWRDAQAHMNVVRAVEHEGRAPQ